MEPVHLSHNRLESSMSDREIAKRIIGLIERERDKILPGDTLEVMGAEAIINHFVFFQEKHNNDLMMFEEAQEATYRALATKRPFVNPDTFNF